MRRQQHVSSGPALKDERGFTLLEIAVVVGLVGTLAIVISRLSVDVVSSNQVTDVALVRDQLAISARNMAANLPAIRASLATGKNAGVKACVCGTGTCTSMQSQPFNLFDPTGVNVVSPKYYNAQGNACTPVAVPSGTPSNCFFAVTTTAVAECPPKTLPATSPDPTWQCGAGTSNTKPADFLQVVYAVTPSSTNNASATVLKTISGGVYVSVSDIVTPVPGPSPFPSVCP